MMCLLHGLHLSGRGGRGRGNPYSSLIICSGFPHSQREKGEEEEEKKKRKEKKREEIRRAYMD